MTKNNHMPTANKYQPADTDNFSTAPVAPRPDRRSTTDAPSPTLSLEAITEAARIFQKTIQREEQANSGQAVDKVSA